MDFELSEAQRQLADSVGRYLADHYDFESRKTIVQSDSGASDVVWRWLAELGVLSIPFSEAGGGFGGGAVDMMSAMQSIGQALVVEPVLSSSARRSGPSRRCSTGWSRCSSRSSRPGP